MKQRPEYKSGDAGGTKKRRAISAKWRLLIALTLLTVSSLVIFWVAQSVFLGKIYIGIKKKVLRETSNALQSASADTLADKIETLGRENEICIGVYRISPQNTIEYLGGYDSKLYCDCLLHQLQLRTLKGKPGSETPQIKEDRLLFLTDKALSCDGFCILELADTPVPDDHAELPGGISIQMKTIDGKIVDTHYFDGRIDVDNLTAISTVKQNDGGLLVCFINTSVVPLASTIETINTLMAYLSIVVIIAAVIFALIIALWITRPIEEINKSAKRLAECDYSVRFGGSGYKEVEELSDTLNYAADELSKVDNLQKELIANISHDLRTPLTLIAGYAEVMRDLPDEKTEENLQIIIDESNRMKALVNDVLDISKLGSGTANLNLEVFPLTNSIESELTRYNKLRDREGYIIEFDYDEQVSVSGDYTRLMQVVYNLVNNAVNYAGDDKKVIVSQTVKDGRVRVSVTDHGEGIAEEELPKIWDRYYKVDKTHKRATVGSGLGLSIVKGVISAHKGIYGVTSVKGEGSTFYFELPVHSVTPLDR